MLKILFIGDISGRIGRQAVAKLVPKLKKEHNADLVIANAENAAHGTGITLATVKELMDAGIDYLTTGDHAFDKDKKSSECYDGSLPVLRPANFPPSNHGVGFTIIEASKHRVLLINLIGRVFMHMDYDCPFRNFDEIFANFAKQNLSAIIVDIHAEATSEKLAMKYHVDGKISALIGTHTHVMTADSSITDHGTAYISDVGMTGYADGILGVEKHNIIDTFMKQVKYPHVIPEKGKAVLNAVLVGINPKTGKASSIKPIAKTIEIS